MEIKGTQTIAAPRQQVWDALNNPEILKKSLPGCESVERTSSEEFKVIVATAIGPLRARFNGVLRMSDVQAPESCKLVFEGQGGAIGFGKGNSWVHLTESHGQTELIYTAEAQVGGKLAQVGSRLIDSIARKMADDFFQAFKSQLVDASQIKPAEASLSNVLGSAISIPQVSDSASEKTAPDATNGSLLANGVLRPELAPHTSVVMVPGWWLGVSAAIGSIATMAGVLLAR